MEDAVDMSFFSSSYLIGLLTPLTSRLRRLPALLRLLRSYVSANGFLSGMRQIAVKSFRKYRFGGFAAIIVSLRRHAGLQNRGASLLSVIAELLTSEIEIPTLPASVDVLIPVYNGLEHLPRLFDSLFENSTTPHRFIIINDASTDPEVERYIGQRIEGREDCLFLSNSVNLGFPATINRGAQEARGHFVILNTDVIVPPDWLQRLMKPIFFDERIASCTPFSNSATIFSFPLANQDNTLPDGCTLSRIDTAFRRLSSNIGRKCEALSGVGFCMGINMDTWRSIGEFDAETFQRGYGEENDWCQRAIAAGWRNVLVPNLFAFHAHGGSFPSEEKRALIERNIVLLESRWPNYRLSVAAHVDNDPFRDFRAAGILSLALSREARPLLLIDHSIGGGANEYSKQRLEKAQSEGRSSIYVTYHAYRDEIEIRTFYKGMECLIVAHEPEELLALGDIGHLESIVYNDLVGWKAPEAMISVMMSLKKKSGAALEILFHDYFPVCPSYVLIDDNTRYCGVPEDLETCRHCLPRAIRMYDYKYQPADIAEWRKLFQEAIYAADLLVFFSNASRLVVERAYTLLEDRIRIAPHVPLCVFEKPYVLPVEGPLTIGIVGNIDVPKGAHIVLELAKLLEKQRPEARVVVIGRIAMRCKRKNVTITGAYPHKELPDFLAKFGITVAFVPSICPETFSYVTQELMMLEVPVVCFDLGAPAERIRSYEKGKVVHDLSAASALAAIEALDRVRLKNRVSL